MFPAELCHCLPRGHNSSSLDIGKAAAYCLERLLAVFVALVLELPKCEHLIDRRNLGFKELTVPLTFHVIKRMS
jgi:hypothetical protein